MDKKYSDNKTIVETVKRFQQILEYTNAAGAFSVNEAGEDENPEMPQDPNMEQPMGGPEMGGDPNAMGGPEMGGDPNAMGGPEMGGDPNMEQPMGDDMAQGFAPQAEEQPMEQPAEEEEEVIDVDDLTNAQEETEDKLDSLTSKFDSLLDKIEAFEKRIDDSNERMENLKSEIEKRNPTPVEKLSLRSGSGYPFNQTPEEYWKEKEATSNYRIADDKNGAEDVKYQITKDDIDNFNDYASISKTFDNFGLNDMFNY